MEMPNNITEKPMSTKSDKADNKSKSIEDLAGELDMPEAKAIAIKSGQSDVVMAKLGMLDAMTFSHNVLNQKMVMNARIYEVIFKLIVDMYSEVDNGHAQVIIDLTQFMLQCLIKGNNESKDQMQPYLEVVLDKHNGPNPMGAFLVSEVFADNPNTLDKADEETMIQFLRS